jgi:hypothetical protein
MTANTELAGGLRRARTPREHLLVQESAPIGSIARSATAFCLPVRSTDDDTIPHSVAVPTLGRGLCLGGTHRTIGHMGEDVIFRAQGHEVSRVDAGSAMALVVDMPACGVFSERIDISEDVRLVIPPLVVRSGVGVDLRPNRDTPILADNPTRPSLVGSSHTNNLHPVTSFVNGRVS